MFLAGHRTRPGKPDGSVVEQRSLAAQVPALRWDPKFSVGGRAAGDRGCQDNRELTGIGGRVDVSC